MISLPMNSNRDLPSALCGALAGRCIDLGGTGAQETHLYTALAIGWRKASAAASTLFDELRRLEETEGDNFDVKSATHALTTLIYVATEAFDFYALTLPKVLETSRKKSEVQLIQDYRRAVKRLRDPIALMCNRMKHNYREIVAGRVMSEPTGQTTFIYRINTTRDGVQVPDRQIHHDGGFASFQRTLHEIVHGLLRADWQAGELAARLSDNSDAAVDLTGPTNLGLAGVLDGLGRQAPIVASSEPARFDGIEVSGDTVVLSRVAARRIAEPTKRTISVTVDEAARSVEVFV